MKQTETVGVLLSNRPKKRFIVKQNETVIVILSNITETAGIFVVKKSQLHVVKQTKQSVLCGKTDHNYMPVPAMKSKRPVKRTLVRSTWSSVLTTTPVSKIIC